MQTGGHADQKRIKDSTLCEQAYTRNRMFAAARAERHALILIYAAYYPLCRAGVSLREKLAGAQEEA